MFAPPRVIAWELTRSCPLKCRHCRAAATCARNLGELARDQIIKAISTCPARLIIWTGGEPMVRSDLEELVAAAKANGIESVLAPCGMLVTDERLSSLKAAGVRACSFSVDGATREMHDSWRGVDGAWDGVMKAIACARRVGMPFQINTVVSHVTLPHLKEIHSLAGELGATRHDLFFLVPAGRASALKDLMLSLSEMDEVRSTDFGGIPVHFTCHPDGCIGGRGFAFISAQGELRMCGFTDVNLGSLPECGFNMHRLFETASNPPKKGACR